MATRRRVIMVIGIAVVLLALAVMVSAQAINMRQGDFVTLIQELSAQGKPITFLFDRPITGTTTTLSTDSAQASIGTDYVCFGAPWNDGELRQYCTPFSNIISVTFTETASQ